MVNVDFDFYNLNPDVDQYVPPPTLFSRMLIFRMAVKRLLRQTLSHDDEMIEVHSLAELILGEGVRLGAGSSIKTDGEESDPWGLVGVVDIAKHRVSLLLLPPSLVSLLCFSFVLIISLHDLKRTSAGQHTLGPVVLRHALIDRKTQH
jgi:hypothetical protein